MRPKVDPSIENPGAVRGARFMQPANSEPSVVVEWTFNAFQGRDLELVKVRIGLTGEVERNLLVKREEFVCVLEKIPKPALRRPEPGHLHTRVYPALTLVPFVGLSHVAYKLLNRTNKFGGTKRIHPQIDAQLDRLRA